MLTGFLIIAVVSLLTVVSHRSTRLEEKVYKNVPLSDWMAGIILPVILYLCWVQLVFNITSRPAAGIIRLDDLGILALSVFFLIFSFIGNSMHMTSKILWRYLKKYQNSTAYRVNEMFHGRLSHYLVYMDAIILTFLLPVLEINHPLSSEMAGEKTLPVFISGVLFGFAASKSIFYMNQWFGGYTKPIFIQLSGLLLGLVWTFREMRLDLAFYPVSYFIISAFISAVASFLIRQIFIFARLENRKKLRLLGRILSV